MTTDVLQALILLGLPLPPSVSGCCLRWSHEEHGHIMTAYPLALGQRRCEWADGKRSVWARSDLCCEDLLLEAFSQR